MKSTLFLLIATICFSSFCKGQTADEIVNNAIQKTGGASNWAALKGFKITAKFDQGGVEFPLEIVQLRNGRKYTQITFQEDVIKQGVFDGTVLWRTNFQTMEPEKSDGETTSNVKLDSNDFPDALLNYRDKGYKVELVGKESMEGTEAFKLKLIKEPITINGQKFDDIIYYYFDSETFLPVAREFEMKHGPIKESIMVIKMSDFRDVDGLLFPFSMSQGVKDAPPQPLIVESIELNPKISSDAFEFPSR